ncbi:MULTISPECIES: gamma-glutamyltransferase [Gammaproteobacteria]|uniref:gamma-glutamyltransferase n=1 Tax=Gammaproteobacteria TaxID=1236 RepID=UPI0019136257|nr:gamma-glutamyltransferase [Bacillus sp. TH86]MBK5313119.1 gamma-glutamyltransferase [Pseudomonas sp. TH71]MBK5318618.1 gamma-glutamyltransferase [Erwinia sp. TH79]MBK5324120.1 gamma-glutamyltransferase [Bacillus sp. TH59]MBK5339070.1 gamma-glutamyltransferase [Bacillus sp. TH57]MBK5372323.1 gamma-glutamyltransferase [Pseudomonas sp. TH40]MBK5383492.1 gamma-glutamyltransferase [Pseudomonas sp. TH35]MBK5388951.1 gamma-glutamyltransferase [Pseudomonas sp. TH38]MBK5406246.1 gamma-glutamyltra
MFSAFHLSRYRLSAFSLIATALTLAACSAPPSSPSVSTLPVAPEIASGYRTDLQTRYASKHMAAAANPLAAEAGRQMMREGGSAIDAAIAMQAVLTLVEPQSSGIGGGALIVLWDGKVVRTYDGRETAPAGATEKLFLQADGKPMPFTQAQIGGRSVGTPGVLRALELAHQKHGRLPWAKLFEPAIKLAEQGFAISPRLHQLIAADAFIQRSPDMAAYFLNADGSPKAIGTQLKNPALAAVLKRIAKEGPDALYKGPIAKEIVAKVQGHANPGSLSLNDLQGYKAKERGPLCTDYKRWQVCGMPPPSSGGIAVAQILGTLQALESRDPRFALAPLKPVKTSKPAGIEPAPEAVHLIAEAERLAYADRAQYVADTDFVPVPVKGLIDPTYLASRAALIGDRSMGQAKPGTPPGIQIAYAPDRSPLRISTSQVVAVDDEGGAVSMTTTVEAAFGSHLMVQGFLLNNQMTDFSFISEENGQKVANRVEPGKRPRSSMAPTLIFDRQSGEFLVTVGSPGGSQIIEYVAKSTIGLLDWNLDPQAAINLPNFGSRNGPTELEQGQFSPALIQALKDKGHNVNEIEMTSGTQAIVRVKDAQGKAALAGGADPRREGEALGD